MDSSLHWDAEKMLKRYIYNYLVKRNLHTTALAFKNEADVLAPDVPAVLDDTVEGFLLEWWRIFCGHYFEMLAKQSPNITFEAVIQSLNERNASKMEQGPSSSTRLAIPILQSPPPLQPPDHCLRNINTNSVANNNNNTVRGSSQTDSTMEKQLAQSNKGKRVENEGDQRKDKQLKCIANENNYIGAMNETGSGGGGSSSFICTSSTPDHDSLDFSLLPPFNLHEYLEMIEVNYKEEAMKFLFSEENGENAGPSSTHDESKQGSNEQKDNAAPKD
ncbi:LIS1 homology motif-containing protein [Dioscorea alata]|uniref:LIS1 homology motif-containing protein n=1 Tax=Dioscorea alata TaxID=55571 RepID=A0ACB7VMR6_DIOAL|nr:LIS1 homology motif-containing protein [Dioscorea alata]